MSKTELAFIERGGGHWETPDGRLAIWDIGRRRFLLDVDDKEHSTHRSYEAAVRAAEAVAQR